MRHSHIGSLRSRSVGAIIVVVVLAATVLATLVVGASAANSKTNHHTRAHAQRTTAHPMRTQGGGPVPTHPPVTG
jgi:hypothetical protein